MSVIKYVSSSKNQKQTKNALTKKSLHGVLIDEMIHVKNLLLFNLSFPIWVSI